jgi:hypothetical protein
MRFPHFFIHPAAFIHCGSRLFNPASAQSEACPTALITSQFIGASERGKLQVPSLTSRLFRRWLRLASCHF